MVGMALAASLQLVAQSTGIIQWDDESGMVFHPLNEIPLDLREDSLRYKQISGFPKPFIADQTFKNFRNVTLEDLDENGSHEIIFGIQNNLYVWSSPDTIWWKKELPGLAIYPPSIADLNYDGEWEIVLTTAGIGNEKGSIMILNENGADWPGWPITYNDHWMLLAPAISNVDQVGNQEIIVSERISPTGQIHILNTEGQELNENWPLVLPNTPAVTPSIGDINQDGINEIVICSSRDIFVLDLNGNALPGWPVVHSDTKFSYQSPLLLDLDGDQTLEIIGSSIGDRPEYYAFDASGQYVDGWPFPTTNQTRTFSPPTAIKIDEEWNIFMARPIGEFEAEDMLYRWSPGANLVPNFPIKKVGGNEGFISIADIDDDGEMEVIFGSNLNVEGNGYIHAYELDGETELAGFPLRPRGWTYMNGASLGDVDGDGSMDLTALSYISSFGLGPDTTFLNVYDLNTPYTPGKILWGTYKGDNTRSGNLASNINTGFNEMELTVIKPFPNPTTDILYLPNTDLSGDFEIYNIAGVQILSGKIQSGSIPVSHLSTGIYILRIIDRSKNLEGLTKWIKE